MNTSAIRQKLHQYVDHSDDKILKLMYALVREYYDEPVDEDFNYEFTDEELQVLKERSAAREYGKSKTHSWEAAQKIIGK